MWTYDIAQVIAKENVNKFGTMWNYIVENSNLRYDLYYSWTSELLMTFSYSIHVSVVRPKNFQGARRLVATLSLFYFLSVWLCFTINIARNLNTRCKINAIADWNYNFSFKIKTMMGGGGGNGIRDRSVASWNWEFVFG